MAAEGGDSQVYATLLLSDSYLPGALVLAHSLRDARTTKKLAVLVTLDSVSSESITQLKAVYDYIFPVPRIRNDHPANLYLMNRADLHSAFTKINLWRLTQFSKVVYIDADVVAYRAPDELFDIPEPFSAAPDIGWPDLFNTGVMVLTPNMGDYYAMKAMADRGISFDGADQGLLNMHFRNNYNSLSFTYNVTPSAHYQYIPAYRHFQSSINMVHFIGSDKPWFTGRNAPHGNSPFDEMVGRWWAVYDRHYRVKETSQERGLPDPGYVQYFTKGEYQPSQTAPPPPSEQQQQQQRPGEQHHQGRHDLAPLSGNPPPLPSSSSSFSSHPPPSSRSPPPHHHVSSAPSYDPPVYNHPAPQWEQHEEHQDHPRDHDQPPPAHHDQPPEQHHHHHHQPESQHEPPPEPHHEHQFEHHHEHQQEYQHHHDGQLQPLFVYHHEEHRHEPYHVHDDAQLETSHPPPASASDHAPHVAHFVPLSESISHAPGTQAEARTEQQVPQHHDHDGGAPLAEQKKPEPHPISMASWDAQRQPPPADSKPEALNFPSTHYTMSQDTTHFVPPERYPSPPRNMWYEVPKERPAPTAQPAPAIFPWEGHQPRPTRKFGGERPEAAPEEEPPSSEHLEESTTTLDTSTTAADAKSVSSAPTTPTVKITPVDPWTSFTRVNAWDDVPEIERYVEGLPWHRRVKSQGQSSTGRSPGNIKSPFDLGKVGRGGVSSFRLTDFPSEVERPSLPVTPAPIRRPKFWGSGDAGEGEEGGPKSLPAAEGVPLQSDWDPMEQLQKLAQQQSEILLRKLGGEQRGGGGSEPGETGGQSSMLSLGSVPGVLSPQPVKGKASTSILRGLSGDHGLVEGSRKTTTTTTETSAPATIPQPSYSGPGAAWERGEDFLQHETPLPPTDEERDVLDT